MIMRALTTALYGVVVFLAIAVGVSLYISYQAFLTTGVVEGLLLTKSEAVITSIYYPAFYVHVLTGSVVLITGAFQFSKALRVRFPKGHQFVGRIYSLVLLLFAAPAGFVMSFYANGGVVAKLGFALLASFWFYFTWRGLQLARRKRFVDHRAFMLRSYALTFASVTLRLYLTFFAIAGYHGDLIYSVVAWMCWVPSLAVVELWLKWDRSPSLQNAEAPATPTQ